MSVLILQMKHWPFGVRGAGRGDRLGPQGTDPGWPDLLNFSAQLLGLGRTGETVASLIF